MPFSLQKITWTESTKTVIYRSRKHWRTKRNFEVFQAADFIAAAVQHIPPKGQQTVRYYGLYSNRARGMADTNRPMLIPAPAPVPLEKKTPADEILLVPAPPKQTARAMRPLWRALKEWTPVENPEEDPGWFDQSNPWQPQEIHQDDRIFVLDAE